MQLRAPRTDILPISSPSSSVTDMVKFLGVISFSAASLKVSVPSSRSARAATHMNRTEASSLILLCHSLSFVCNTLMARAYQLTRAAPRDGGLPRASHPAPRRAAQCAGVAGAAIVAGAVPVVHQPARAVAMACLGAVAALLPICSSICIPLWNVSLHLSTRQQQQLAAALVLPARSRGNTHVCVFNCALPTPFSGTGR
jgi:hypothetical protein